MVMKDLVKKVGFKLGINQKLADDAIKAVAESIMEAVNEGDSITIKGFGRFDKSHRGPRRGRNMHTNEEVIIEARTVPKFKAGKHFKELINGDIESL